MEKISSEIILEKLNWRYAVKKFDPKKKISHQDWATLEESLRLSPSSFGLQPWKFLIVQSPDIREKLTEASFGQPQIETCSHFVVVTHLKTLTEAYVENYFRFTKGVRSLPPDALQQYYDAIMSSLVKGPRAATINHWAARQTYIAMGFFMETAAFLNIDVCPMEGISTQQYDEILSLKDSPYATAAALAAGYRASDDPAQHEKKVRFDRDDVIQVIE